MARGLIGKALSGAAEVAVPAALAEHKARIMAKRDEKLYGRKKEMADLEYERRQEMSETEHKRRKELYEDKTSRSEGYIQSTVTTDDGEVVGITKTGEKIPIDIKEQTEDMSAEDKRIFDSVVDRYTTENDLDGKVVDNEAAAEHLQQLGYPKLAALLKAPGSAGSIDTNSEEWLQARKDAEKWADSKAGYFSTDSTDFEEYGGNREEAIQARQLELYQQRTGRSESQATDSGQADGSSQYEKGKVYKDSETGDQAKFLGGDPMDQKNWEEVGKASGDDSQIDPNASASTASPAAKQEKGDAGKSFSDMQAAWKNLTGAIDKDQGDRETMEKGKQNVLRNMQSRMEFLEQVIERRQKLNMSTEQQEKEIQQIKEFLESQQSQRVA